MLIIGYKNDGVCRLNGNLVFRLCAQDVPLQNVYFRLAAPDVFRGCLKERCVFIPYIFPDSDNEFTIPYRCAHSFNRSEADFHVTVEFSANGSPQQWRGSFRREFEVRQNTLTQNIYNIRNETTVNGASNGFAYVDNGTTLPGQTEPEQPADIGKFKPIDGRLFCSESSQKIPLLVQIDSGKDLERGVKNELIIYFSPCFHVNTGRDFILRKLSGTLAAGGKARAFVLDRFTAVQSRTGDYSFERYEARIPISLSPDITRVDLCQLTCSGEMNGVTFHYSMQDGLACHFPVLKDAEHSDIEDLGVLPVTAGPALSAKALISTGQNMDLELCLRALACTDPADQELLLRKLGGSPAGELRFTNDDPQDFSVHSLSRFNYEIKETPEPEEEKESGFAKACRLFGKHGDGLNPGAAFEIFRKEYESAPDDRKAAMYLGECYLLGTGTPRDEVKGVELLRQAADAGAADAMLSYAECCFAGIGMDKDPENGKKYLLAAVQAGNVDAKCRLAGMYLTGDGVPENLDEAVRLYTEAAGTPDADYAAACIKYFGLDGARDAAFAAGIFEKLAATGHIYAKVMHAKCHEKTLSRDEIETLCSTLPEGDSALHGLAYTMLGDAALAGNDHKKAALYYRKGCECGNVRAIYQFAMCCLEGKGITRNSRDGVELLKCASLRKHRPAMLELAECYLRGIGMYADPDAGFTLLEEFIPLEDPRGDFLLGMCYYHGMGTEENEKKGIMLFRRSAENGYMPAQEYLKEIL